MTRQSAREFRTRVILPATLLSMTGVACWTTTSQPVERQPIAEARVTPGITVLLKDSIHLVAGKKVGLLTNQTGINEDGVSDIDLLHADPNAKRAGVQLALIFAPEHGIRGTEDRENLSDDMDSRTGVRIVSLYGRATLAPPDSVVRALDVFVFDLQDIGTRTWTYEGAMVYAMRAAARAGKPFIVLDRPNPIGGANSDGPLLDEALANPNDPTPTRPGRAYAMYQIPLRHGLTMGELARYYNETLHINANLHVVPARGWRRDVWYDGSGLRWVKPSPNMPSLESALIYPATVAFEGTNLSVGRGTDIAFQHVGAPWLKAEEVAKILNERRIAGVKFSAESFRPDNPTDKKFAGRTIPGVRVEIVKRDAIQTGRVGAALLWAIARTSLDSLRVDTLVFDLRFGSPAIRRALLKGEDPDSLIDGTLPAVVDFRRRARDFFIYR